MVEVKIWLNMKRIQIQLRLQKHKGEDFIVELIASGIGVDYCLKFGIATWFIKADAVNFVWLPPTSLKLNTIQAFGIFKNGKPKKTPIPITTSKVYIN